MNFLLKGSTNFSCRVKNSGDNDNIVSFLGVEVKARVTQESINSQKVIQHNARVKYVATKHKI